MIHILPYVEPSVPFPQTERKEWRQAMRVLTDSQIEQIQTATEDILANTGFSVAHTEMLYRAKKAGAIVDEATRNVKIPVPVLRNLLSQVPTEFKIYGLCGSEHTIGGENQFCSAITADPWIVDYETAKPRRPCLDDVKTHTIVAQMLDEVATVSRMDFPVTDCDDATSSLRSLETHLLNHSKHYYVYVTSMDSFRQWLDIGRILSPGRDLSENRLFSVAVAVVSPLSLNDVNAELLMSACEYNFPILPTICPMAGTTSPYSLSSTLLLGHAENIFLAALTQIVKPGNPFLYMFGPSVCDMRNGHDLYYTMDKVLWKIAAVQLAKAHGMPVGSECGGTMTFRYDQQNGAEGMLFMLAAQGAGSNILSGIGSCHNANGMSAEMMIIQNEWLKTSKFLGRGIDTSSLQQGLDSIKRVGNGGHFLTDDFTLDRLHGDEFFRSDIFDCGGGYFDSSSMLENAHKKVEEMKAGYESPVPGAIQENLRAYFHNLYKTKK